MLGSIIGPISSLAGTWLQGRVDKAKAETEVKVAKAEARSMFIVLLLTSEMLNEQALTAQMVGSWKDEFWTLFLVYSCGFFVPYPAYVKEGFDF